MVEHPLVVAGVVDVAGRNKVREVPDEVHPADRDRVQAELARGLVHHLLEHPVVHLGAEAPVGALLVLVGQRRAHIPAITAGLLANSLEPKLPPAGTGLMSSLLTGTLSVPAAMNR